MHFSIDVAQDVEIAIAFLQVRDAEEVGCPRTVVWRKRFRASAVLMAYKEPCTATYYDHKESYSPHPLDFLILYGGRLNGVAEYGSLALSRHQHDVRIEIAVGKEHLFLSLFGDADSPHGHIGLARLHGRNLRGEVHNEVLQLPVTPVGPFRQQFRLQTRRLSIINEIEWRHGRIGGYAQDASRAALLGNVHGLGVVGIAPAIQNLLVGAVTADFGQKTVEVLLQFGIIQTVTGSYRNRRKSCAHRIHLFKQLLVEHQRQAFTACRIYLAVL